MNNIAKVFMNFKITIAYIKCIRDNKKICLMKLHLENTLYSNCNSFFLFC